MLGGRDNQLHHRAMTVKTAQSVCITNEVLAPYPRNEKALRCRESNPGHLRDRQVY